MAEMLVGHRYIVHLERDGDAALRWFQAHQRHVAIVLADQNMPRMRGLELAQELRSIDKQTQILLCTGYADDLDKLSASCYDISAVLMELGEPRVLLERLELVR